MMSRMSPKIRSDKRKFFQEVENLIDDLRSFETFWDFLSFKKVRICILGLRRPDHQDGGRGGVQDDLQQLRRDLPGLRVLGLGQLRQQLVLALRSL